MYQGLKYDQKNRPTAAKLLKHHWLTPPPIEMKKHPHTEVTEINPEQFTQSQKMQKLLYLMTTGHKTVNKVDQGKVASLAGDNTDPIAAAIGSEYVIIEFHTCPGSRKPVSKWKLTRDTPSCHLPKVDIAGFHSGYSCLGCRG